MLRLLLCAILVLAPSLASAGKWPKPAGGTSASGNPEVVLTFDDGPHERHTAALLDALKKHGHKAIFFWTGNRVLHDRKGKKQRLALVTRAVREGHLVGNHTTTHAQLCAVSAKEAAREIDDNAKLYEKLSQLPLFLMRVPYGAKCKRLEKMLESRSIKHFHWDIDPQEFLSHDSEHALRYVSLRLRRLKAGERAVLLMHDTQPTTARAIPKILAWIDQENTRRRNAGKKEIRVVSGSQIVAEQYDVELLRWTHRSLIEARSALLDRARSLVAHRDPGAKAAAL